MNNRLINSIFETPMGKVLCELQSEHSKIEKTGTNEYENGESVVYLTHGHRVELIDFKIRLPLYNGETVTDSNAWIWRIEKRNDSDERLAIRCVLKDYTSDVFFDLATGENLDAIEATNDVWVLHIGTEDGEIMNSRAGRDDWFPSRLSGKVDFHQSITRILKEGFETEIPPLDVGEQIHAHYITAYDKRNKESVNTWLAVDETKRNLGNWVGIFNINSPQK